MISVDIVLFFFNSKFGYVFFVLEPVGHLGIPQTSPGLLRAANVILGHCV